MNKQTEALRMAKQHIIERKGGRGGAVCYVKSDEDVIKAIDEALAQPAQEPVAVVYSMQDGYVGQMVVKDIPHKTKLYTHIAPSWQGLSDDEIHNYADHNFAFASEHFDEIFNFGRAIEQALKEKNT